MTTETEPRPTKAEVLSKMDQRYGELDALLAPLSDAHMTVPGRLDGWSVKDHLAHLAAWQRSLIALLEGTDRIAALGVDEQAARAASAKDFDAINALIYRTFKDRPLVEVRAEFQATRARVRELLDGMTDDDLARPYAHYQPNDPHHNPHPVIGWIAGNTYEHVDEHLDGIRALLSEQGH